MVVLQISSIKSLNLEEGKTFIFYEMKHKMRKKFGGKISCLIHCPEQTLLNGFTCVTTMGLLTLLFLPKVGNERVLSELFLLSALCRRKKKSIPAVYPCTTIQLALHQSFVIFSLASGSF